MDGGDDDRTFRVIFSADGARALRHRVTEKLKEFMGDYTDDTLVEYVVVLLRNGRRKAEARNELNVFLGDDSDSFISWLWDHLGSNLNLYVQPQEHLPDVAPQAKSETGEPSGRNDSNQLEPGPPEKVKSSRSSRIHHKREWNGLVTDGNEQPPVRSSIVNSTRKEEESRRTTGRVKRSLSPQPFTEQKRSRREEREQIKREVGSQPTIGAPRRLLQFAVRDAVAPAKSNNLIPEPSFRRLRSVVSTSTEDSAIEKRPQRMRSAVRLPSSMAIAVKAVAAAAEDVKKMRSSGNVFDRLGRATDVPDTPNYLAEFREGAPEDESGDFEDIKQDASPIYQQRTPYVGSYPGNQSMRGTATGVIDSVSDNEGYDDANVIGRGDMDLSVAGTSGGAKHDDLMMSRNSRLANSVDGMMRKPRADQDRAASGPNNSRKIVNISVNVNTWRQTRLQEPRQVSEVDTRISLEDRQVMAAKSIVPTVKQENNPVVVDNGNAKADVDAQTGPLKVPSSTPSVYSTGLPTEDADSRTIFVSNVHFGATKDSLSRHFNKFGEVLKVIILTDAATGLPKGSAYVEFMRKEAAEHALSLDGTSFMSRIIKVVKKSAAQPEAASIMTWPRAAWGSPFAASRFGRTPFPRGIPSVYRARPPIRPGARSMQWKRDAQSAPTEIAGQAAATSVLPPATRSLTYVRTEAKTNGSSGTA